MVLFPIRGAVCGSHWDDNAAKVSCRMLGLPLVIIILVHSIHLIGGYS